MLLKELPVTERPRERGLKKGVNHLSTAELLAIILRTGSKKYSVMETANQILSKINSPSDLNYLSVPELTDIEGIGKTKAITILAAIELGKRLNQLEEPIISFFNSKEVFNYMKDELKFLKEENLYVLYLNAKGKLIEKKRLTIGNINQTLIDSKLIFKWAYKLSASAFIIIHNHPSGDAFPSKSDIEVTKIIANQAKTLGLIILDHIIIGTSYYSFKEQTNILE